MELTCADCGKTEMGLGWPADDLCQQCGHKRDMKMPKACPFCGVNAVLGVQNNPDEEPGFYMVCLVCQARGPESDVQELAVYEWNRRALESFHSNYQTTKTKNQNV